MPFTTLNASVLDTQEDFWHRVPPVSFSQEIQKVIPARNAYYNKKQYQILKMLENSAVGDVSAHLESCQANTEVFSEIHDFNSYPELYKQFLLHWNCRNFPLVSNQPAKCSGNGTFLLLAIKSAPQSFERRQAVRETWGKEGTYRGFEVRLVFLVGMTDKNVEPDLQELVSHEGSHFQDILQWDFRDSFFNLTLKENLFFKWVMNYCLNTTYIFKGDDDVFVNTFKMMDYLASVDTNKSHHLYTGQVISEASPFHGLASKYYVPASFYDGPYPVYVTGGGLIFSGQLVKKLHWISKYIPFYPIDDVYTGMCFQSLGLQPEKHPDFQTFGIAQKDMENPCVHQRLMVVHQKTPQQMKSLWKAMLDPNLKC
nr:PREDICTED: UDP-GlcNAc:betaGal beta-1,3-N-acetylglucosaminyltransferase 8 [Latimeria chalumnae]|eukprot:XP_005987973.1 PREDICTED: UDP-GlcNAc:betaGal beta-1,3-N-acetylglucosaminyltransferase 8 [Latimeria chalumnae]